MVRCMAGHVRGFSVVGLLAIGALLCTAPAQAVVARGPNGPIGYLPLNGEGPGKATPFNAAGNLDYHGGPVMHSNASYAIFWAPSGFSFAPGYKSATIQYLQNVAADSGKATNVYAVG